MKVLILLPLLFISGSSAAKEWDPIYKVLSSWKNKPALKLWPGYESGKPTKVSMGLWIHTFHGTPVEAGTIAYEGYLVMIWNDPRLAYNKTLGKIIPDADEMIKNIWIPQIHYPNTKSVSFSSTGADMGMIIWPTGHVLMVRRFVAELDCYMKFYKFPFDKQKCVMYFYKLGYNYNQVQLSWAWHHVEPSTHPMFKLTNSTPVNVIRNYTSAAWQYMGTQLDITRNHGHYVSTWYVPTIFIIGLMYIAFWMPESYLLAKTLLTTALYFSYIWLMVASIDDGPKVPYLTEFDKWFLVNFLFMTFAIIEVLVFHLVYAYVRGDVKVEDLQTKKEEGQEETGTSPNAELFELDFKLRVMRGINWGLRIAFPAAYLLFIIIYFALNRT